MASNHSQQPLKTNVNPVKLSRTELFLKENEHRMKAQQPRRRGRTEQDEEEENGGRSRGEKVAKNEREMAAPRVLEKTQEAPKEREEDQERTDTPQERKEQDLDFTRHKLSKDTILVTRKTPTIGQIARFYFDGARRGTRGGAACGYWNSWSCWSGSSLASTFTSNRAELEGLIRLLSDIKRTVSTFAAQDIKAIEIYGDSIYVIDLANSLPNYSLEEITDETFANAEEVRKLKTILSKLSAVTLSLVQVPRLYNAAADEVCNAVLDGRHPRPIEQLSSDKIFTLPDDDAIFTAAVRRPSCFRSVPQHCLHQWALFMDLLCSDGPDFRASVALCAPTIFLRRSCCSINSLPFYLTQLLNSRSHRMSIVQSFLENDWRAALNFKPSTVKSDKARLVMKAQRLTGLGAYSKAIQALSPSASADSAREVNHLFPKRKADIPTTTVTPDILAPSPGKIFKVVSRRISRASAPGFDGLTRELLLPILSLKKNGPAKVFFTKLIWAIMRGDASEVSPSLNEFLRIGSLACLEKSPKKYRPIVLSALVTKVAWRCILDRIKVPPHLAVVQSYRVGCQKLVHRAQSTLDSNGSVFQFDGKNAFGEIKRASIHRKLQTSEDLHCLLPMFDLLYRTPFTAIHISAQGNLSKIQIEEGVLQGDVASPTLFILGIACALERLQKEEALSIADDLALTATLKTARCISSFAKNIADIIAALNLVGIDIQQNKSLVLGTKSDEVRRELRVKYGIDVSDHTRSDYLGGVISCPHSSMVELKDLRSHYTKRLDTLIRFLPPPGQIEERLSCQCALLLVSHTLYAFSYLFSTSKPKAMSNIANYLKDWTVNCLAAILDCPLQVVEERWKLISLPFQRGGFNMIDYTVFGPSLFDLTKKHGTLAGSIHPMEGLNNLRKEQADIFYKTYPYADKQQAMYIARVFAECDVHWINVRPENSLLTLTNPAWRVNAKLRLFLDMTDSPICDNYQDDVVPKYHHAMNCVHCLSYTIKARHNRVLSALCQSLRDHGIFSSTSLAALTRTNRDEGPDAVIYGDIARAIDIHVNYQGPHSAHNVYSTRKNEASKISKYREFSTTSGWPLHPLGFSTLGVPTGSISQFIKTITQASSTHGLLCRVLASTSIAVARGNADMVAFLEARDSIAPNVSPSGPKH